VIFISKIISENSAQPKKYCETGGTVHGLLTLAI